MLAGLPRICKPWVQQDTPSHKQSEDHPGRHAVSTSASHMHPCAHTQVFVNSCRHTHIHAHYTQHTPKLFAIFKRHVYLLFMHVSVFLCEFVCIRHVWSLWRSEEGVGSSGTRITGSCDLPDRGARNRAPVFYENNVHSYLRAIFPILVYRVWGH